MRKTLVIIWMFFSCLHTYSQTTTVLKDQVGINHKIDSLQQLAKTFFNRGQYAESIKYLNKSLKIIEETKVKAKEPSIYNDLGGCYSELGDNSKALESYYKALRISEELDDKKEMANAYQYIGAIFDDLKDDSLALNNYSEALKINLEMGNKFRCAQNNNSIADINARNGKYADALKIYRESLKIYEEPGAPAWGLPWCYTSIGLTHEWLGDSAINKENKSAAMALYEEALKNHLISLAKYKEADIMGGYSQQYYYTGVVCFKLNRIADAKRYFQNSLQLYIESGTKEALADIYLYLSRIDSLEENYRSAFRDFKLSTLYRDSVFNSEQSRKIAMYKTKYEIDEKEEEIKLLGAENKLKTTIAGKQKQQKIFAYAAIVILVLLGSYAFYRYRIRKKAEVEQAKLKDRLHISQGLHDDIGSTLSSISVYTQVAEKLSEKNSKEELNEMLGKIKDTSFEMISEMNDIVWAIHPKNDSMEKIILRMESYAKPMLMTRNIDFKLEYDPTILTINLEMEKRKNFYLIFKEAINNAFKYSGCSEIVTGISNSNGRPEMKIKDNGVGFDVQQEITEYKLTLSGNGLRNMKMRAEEMKGHLQINSITGEGTEIKLSFPIP